jgi:hypothetical protein
MGVGKSVVDRRRQIASSTVDEEHLPSGSTARPTIFQKDAKRSSGTWESQKPKKHTSYFASGSHPKRSA